MPHEHVTVHSWRQVDLNKSVSCDVKALARVRYPTGWQLPLVEKVSILGNVHIRHTIHNSPLLAFILSQTNPVHKLPPSFLNIYLNIIILFPCPKWQPSFIFPYQNFVYTSLLCMLHDRPPEKKHYCYECLIVQYSSLLSFFLSSITLSSPSSAEFMNRWSMPLLPPPYASMAWAGTILPLTSSFLNPHINLITLD